MRTFCLKTLLFGTIIALFALALAPAMAFAMPDNMGPHCGSSTATTPDSNSCLAHCLFVQCDLSSAGDVGIINFAPANQHVPIVYSNTSSPAEVSLTDSKPILPPPVMESPPHSGVTYQCRNSLNSEDPASL